MSDNPTLETLDAKLNRLIEEWKYVYGETPGLASDLKTVDHNLAEFVAFHPEMFTMPEPFIIHNNRQLDSILIAQLLNAPSDIAENQALFDDADRDYKQQLATISLCALTEPLFAGKKADEPMHAATNDTERGLAIDHFIASDELLRKLAVNREEKLRGLQEAKNRFEAAKLLAQMVCRDSRK